jgi:ketosteroid isomerase-like protein
MHSQRAKMPSAPVSSRSVMRARLSSLGDTGRAMSQENVEVVQRFMDAYNRRDREAVRAVLHRDIEWRTMAGPVFGIEAIHGRDEALSFMFERIPEGIEDFRVIARGTSALASGQVLVVGHYEGHGLASGAAIEMNGAALYRVDGGGIAFFQDFATRAEALEAVGLRE